MYIYILLLMAYSKSWNQLSRIHIFLDICLVEKEFLVQIPIFGLHMSISDVCDHPLSGPIK